MIKKILLLISILITCISFEGCSVITISDKKETDLDYEIIEYHYLDYHLKDLYNSYYSENNRITYDDGNYMYLFIFYGKMPSGGYSVNIKELYSTASNIIVDTTLTGPQKEETTAEKESFPAIVLKIKSSSKTVIYR